MYSSLQASFCTENIRDAGIHSHSLIQCLCKSLEHGFCHVMRVAAVQYLEMQIHAGAVRDSIEEFSHQLGIQLPYTFCIKASVKI